MDWKNQLTKTPVLIFFILLGAIGVGTASALITITLDGDVVITGDATLQGDLTCTDCIDSGEIEDNAVTPSKLSRFGHAAYPLTEQTTVGSERCILGEVRLFASTTVPKGWVPAEGQTLEIFQYPSLFSLIGTIYGGDGRNDFQLPDLSEINPKSSFGNPGLNYAICTEGIFPGAENMIISGDLLVEGQAAVVGDFQVQGQADVIGAPIFSTRSTSEGNTANIIIQRTEGPTAETPSFTLSHRTSDKDLWLYGFDGTTFKNFVGFDYPNYKVTFPSDGDTLVVDAANDQVTIEGKDFEMPWNSRIPSANILTIVDPVGSEGDRTSITIGVDGFPVISYLDDNNDDLKVAKCSDQSCTLSTITTVDSVGLVGFGASITIGVDGFPVISYWDGTNNDLKVAKCDNVSCSSSTLTTVDSVGNVGRLSSITIGVDGFPIISYRDETNQDLKVAKCDNVSCTSSTLTIVDSFGNVGQYSSIAIGADSLPVISYFDSTNADLKVAKCNDQSCISSNEITIDSVGVVGLYSSITIGTDGFPVISYNDASSGDLKVAKCSHHHCFLSSFTIVDSVFEVGSYTSITIGTDGFPVISYYDSTSNDLKVAKCGNHSCTSSILTIVDSVNDVGPNTSIAIGGDGFPVISYFSQTEGSLKVAKCGNPYCISNWIRR